MRENHTGRFVQWPNYTLPTMYAMATNAAARLQTCKGIVIVMSNRLNI